jgi:serine/threonine-protein kinase
MIGARLGKWVLDSELGRGGMGCVYLAHDAEAGPGGPRAAVKVLAAELTTHAGARERFEREIDVLRRLHHPNIVRFYESGEHAGRLYYVMEHVPGRDFADLLADEGRLPWPEVLDMAVQVCAALKHAHDHGVIHRDLKPSNLLRADAGGVKLTDFGIAHVFAGKNLTRTGAVVGTAEYLSPEQAAGKPASKRSDLYSLGVVLYTLLTGRNPFQGKTVTDLLHKHRYAQFDPPGKLRPDLPPDLDEVIRQLLEKEPERRPADAGVLQRRLEAIRNKLAFRGEQTFEEAVPLGATLPAEGITPRSAGPVRQAEGPATLMSRLMRAELEAQNRGGPVRQFFNRPLVLVTLFLLCVGTLVWTFWPAGPGALFQKGRRLMDDPDSSRWEDGWAYLERLQRDYPDSPQAAEVEPYRRKIEDYRASRQAARRAGHGEPLGEAQWFYQKGLRERREGNEEAARATWQNLVRSFRGVPEEQPWVDLAERELKKEGPRDDERRWAPVRAALERARRLRAEGKAAEADQVLDGLEQLYKDDPSAGAILKEVRRERGALQRMR